MQTFIKRLPQSTIVGLSGLILAALLAASLALLVSPNLLPHSVLAATATTCAESPTAKHCNNQDPEVQGCATDANRIAWQDITAQNGDVVGRVERRFSQKCMSWWGRVFAFGPATKGKLSIAIAGVTRSSPPTFVSQTYVIL
jgi:hypothetical protein